MLLACYESSYNGACSSCAHVRQVLLYIPNPCTAPCEVIAYMRILSIFKAPHFRTFAFKLHPPPNTLAQRSYTGPREHVPTCWTVGNRLSKSTYCTWSTPLARVSRYELTSRIRSVQISGNNRLCRASSPRRQQGCKRLFHNAQAGVSRRNHDSWHWHGCMLLP